MDLNCVKIALVIGCFFLITSHQFEVNMERQENKERIIHFPQLRSHITNLKAKYGVLSNMNVSMHRILSRIKDPEDFSKFFGFLKPRIADPPNHNVDVVEPMQAGCTPLLTHVPVTLREETSEFHFPMCVLIERCGGCCFGPYLSCQPERTENVALMVTKIVRNEGSDDTVQEGEVVTVERHLTCGCKCIVRKEDCDRMVHVYNGNECTCDCMDRNAEEQCSQNFTTHFWNPKTCTCFCIKTHKCSTGLYFDHSDCRCKSSSADSRLLTIGFNNANGPVSSFSGMDRPFVTLNLALPMCIIQYINKIT